ncbi:hypothetical protein [Paenibacillus sp. P46E]|uniref:hypothetical protein n=1 Tax=Paenibacillus sp. P46E TaxID=1349436 RepID=UPI00093F1503|nr:hypothetical protein [Paenibacillus sp. P46E]OKP94867.1 hypothetical protein A3849_28625 [Paenibacillus sp. P46E]
MRLYKNTYAAVLAGTFVIGQLAAGLAPGTVQASASTLPSATVAAAVTPKINPVVIGSGVTASLENVNIWTQTGGNILTYTVNYSNASGTGANLLRYFSRVVTPGGSVIPGTPVTADALKKKVGANESLQVTYYVNVGQSKSLQGMRIAMYVWDPKAKGYLRQAGNFAIPANYSTTVENGKSLSTMMNNIPVTASAESLQIFKFNSKVYAKVGLSLINKGNKVLGDPGYTAYLVSASGTSFELSLNSTQDGYKIQPQEKKSIYYLTEIPAYLKTDNMKLQFTQKDETLKLELPGASYKLPAATSPNLVVGNGAIKTIIVNSNTIETKLSNASVYADKASASWSFQLELKNTGNKAVTLPTYELAVKSAKGRTFPVNAKALNGLTLRPLEVKVIPLTAAIPLEVEQGTLQLQMIEAVGQDLPAPTAGTDTGGTSGTPAGSGGGNPVTKLTFPVAYFTIPYALRANIQQGQEYRTTNPYGTFSYSIQSIQRYPWKDDDIVIARLKLTNTQSITLSLPELKAALKLDNLDLTSSTELLMDKESAELAPGNSAEIDVLTKIPYAEEFSALNISLYTTENEEKKPFLALSTSSVMNSVAAIDRGGSYTVAEKGKNSKVQENRTTIYTASGTSKIIYTELLMSNEEKRQSSLARLKAYYRTADGQFYEAQSSQSAGLAAPGGKQMVTFWAKIPGALQTSDMSLYLGTGITGSKLSEAGQEATGYVNVASLKLNPVTAVPVQNLGQISIFPYSFSVIRSEGQITEGSDIISIGIDYKLTQDRSYDTDALDHKLVVKITDPFGLSQEKTLALGTDLTEGDNNTYSLSITRSLYKQLGGGSYKITLYDEFQGGRIELGQQIYYLIYKPLPVIVKDEK